MIYRFGSFTFDTDGFVLASGPQPLSVEPQVFSLIQFLIENRDRVVTKDELFENIWDGRIVSDAALASRINSARRALGDDGKTQAVIRTFPRRGFRFIAEIVGDDDRSGDGQSQSLNRPSIAVLAFNNLSGDTEQEYFSDGISQDIITALSKFRWFFVIAWSSSAAYKGKAVPAREVAAELGVRYVLEGSVRRSSNRVRINVQLVDAATEKHVWAEIYDRETEDIFDLQDDITESIVGAVEPELSAAERERAKRKQPENLDAWDLYQRGMWHVRRPGEEDRETAETLFLRAIELDDGFDAACAGIALVRYLRVVTGWSDTHKEDLDRAIRAAEQAISIDARNPVAHYVLGGVYIMKGSLDSAIAELEEALDLNPNSALSNMTLGFAICWSGRAQESLSYFHKAIRLSPHDPLRWAFEGHIGNA
ncbi:MAG: winged helix-turn-helix domain-containing tetratricopeptide repeat protein, partial [Proteobacteria bacterium]|nr:winged helix-turn-helix domain-containing tetratricopeptide repeat protein [Pseudomonadota bacterium]